MAPSDLSDIGRLELSDLPDAEALVAEAGWNQVRADWRMFLYFGTVYAVRAGERVVATAATLPFGGRCAWISMVLVTAGYRRHGLAALRISPPRASCLCSTPLRQDARSMRRLAFRKPGALRV